MKRIIYILLIGLVLVSCDKEVFTGLVETGITEFGKIFVTSNPKGYKLYIDNRYMNLSSPDSIPLVSEGTHKLTLKHDIFSDSVMNVYIKKQSTLSLTIDMMKNSRFYAKVNCSTNPQGAKIFLNDQPTNLVTPAVIPNVYPGEAEIKFLKNQFLGDSVTMKVKGGEHKELYRILEDTSRTVSYRTSNSKNPSNVLTKVVIDKKNNKWIGSIDRGLIKFDGKNWTSFENNGVIMGSNVQDLLVDRSGKLWIGTTTSLTVLDGTSWQSFTDKIPSEMVVALEEDLYGNIWVATLNALVKYNGNTFQVFNTVNTGVPFLNLSSLSSSKNGDIWVGTSGSGILRFNGKVWYNYKINQMDLGKSNSATDVVKDLIVDKNGILYSSNEADPSLGVAVRVVLKYDGANWSELKLQLLYFLDVVSFYVDTENNIWLVLNGAFAKYNPSQAIKVYDPDSYGYFSKQCTSFAIDLNGDGWLTTKEAGIAKLKKGTF